MSGAPTLDRLATEQGERSLYDAVSQCSRCGYCEQACPTYTASGREGFSPRGRNQLVRLMLEGKLSDPQSAGEALSTCLLCGACTTVCPAHIPTAEIVLEGRRRLRGGEPPWLAAALTGWMARRPGWLERLLRAAYALKRAGLSRLAGRLGLLRLLGLGGLSNAEEAIDEAPAAFLKDELRSTAGLRDSGGARWRYFAACGTNYLFPRVGRATLRALQALAGPGAWLDAGCCGLVCYNYGRLEDARELARGLIAAAEGSSSRDAPVVVDCSSCAAYMKSLPDLFLEEPEWRERARAFAALVRDAVEAFPADRVPRSVGAAATHHDSCRARNGERLAAEPRAAARAACGDFRELPEAEACCGGAGAFAFAYPELSDELLRRKVGAVASVQARVVTASSTSCLLQLAAGLRKYYPEAKVVHLSELVCDALDGSRAAGETS